MSLSRHRTTTTFRHPSPEQIAAAEPGLYDANWSPATPSRDIYSRYTQPTLTRAERVLSSVIGAPTLVYPSGIAAFFACLVHVRPDVVAFTAGEGYHGCHTSLEVYRQIRGVNEVTTVNLDDEYPTDKKVLVWLETPLNPKGESRSIEACASPAFAYLPGWMLTLNALQMQRRHTRRAQCSALTRPLLRRHYSTHSSGAQTSSCVRLELFSAIHQC